MRTRRWWCRAWQRSCATAMAPDAGGSTGVTDAADPLSPLVGFGRDLRERGLPVGTGRILTFCRAVAAMGLSDRDSLYWSGRLSMVGRHEDIASFDEAFEDWYRSLGQGEG